MALQYPVLFPYGGDGYHPNIRIDPGRPLDLDETYKVLTPNQYYRFQLFERSGRENPLHSSGPLCNQYYVDSYNVIERNRLRFIQTHQGELRTTTYGNMMRAEPDAGRDIGRVFLPSSFIGSRRYWYNCYLDTMTYVREFGLPCLFLTVTFSTKWVEYTRELDTAPNCSRPKNWRNDVVTRVFERKTQVIKDLIVTKRIFGELNSAMYSVEWQTLTLPHLHSLIWLKDKLRITEVDKVICAELPDRDADPRLYDYIVSHNIHGPCGPVKRNAVCMKNGKCTKGYPKRFSVETYVGRDGFIQYRRRAPSDGGRTMTLKTRHGDYVIDNSMIVPYSPLLSKMLNCHVCLLSCDSPLAINYVCGYVNKGASHATLQTKSTRENAGRAARDGDGVGRGGGGRGGGAGAASSVGGTGRVGGGGDGPGAASTAGGRGRGGAASTAGGTGRVRGGVRGGEGVSTGRGVGPDGDAGVGDAGAGGAGAEGASTAGVGGGGGDEVDSALPW